MKTLNLIYKNKENKDILIKIVSDNYDNLINVKDENEILEFD